MLEAADSKKAQNDLGFWVFASILRTDAPCRNYKI